MECSKETEYTSDFDCRINNEKRGSYSITFCFALNKQITYMDYTFMLIHRTSEKVLFNVTFDYCKSYKYPPPFVNLLFDIFKKYTDTLLHACPYEPIKRMGIESIPFESQGPVMAFLSFKVGDYHVHFSGADKKGRSIFFMNLFFTMSPVRGQKSGK